MTLPTELQPRVIPEFVNEYISMTPKSRAFHERLSKSLAGGETRVVTHFEPYPIAIAAADGPRPAACQAPPLAGGEDGQLRACAAEFS